MTVTGAVWSRVRRAIDAASLAKLLVCALAFVLWQASPLFALGAVFGVPIVLAVIVWIGRELHFALTGRPPGTPPARLGLPVSQRRHNGSLQLTERPASGNARRYRRV